MALPLPLLLLPLAVAPLPPTGRSSTALAFPLPLELVTEGADDGEVARDEAVAAKVVVEADDPGRYDSVNDSDIEVDGPPGLLSRSRSKWTRSGLLASSASRVGRIAT